MLDVSVGRELVWASPLPPVRSGVSDYAVELLPHLHRRWPVRVALPPSVADLPPQLTKVGIEALTSDIQASCGQIRLVHLGNNPYHEWLLPWLDRQRGVVVLHDLVLHHLLVESTLARGDVSGYVTALAAAHPDAGSQLAEARRYGFTGRRDPFLFPALSLALERSRAAVVHSRWAMERVRRAGFQGPVLELPMGIRDPGPVDRHEVRRRLGIPKDAFVVMHVGFLTPQKGLEVILAAVACARHAGVPVVLVLVGADAGAGAVHEVAARIGVEDCVIGTGWIDSEQFVRAPAAADVGVVLRTPSAGETSAAALRFVAGGTPVLVPGIAQFLELDERAAPRITPGPAAAAECARWIVQLARCPEELEERRIAARQLFRRRHRLEASADRLVSWLHALADRARE